MESTRGTFRTVPAQYNYDLSDGRGPIEILSAAKERISDRDRWTQYAVARDARNRIVRPADPSAVKWCVEGAIAVVSNKWGFLQPFFMLVLDETIHYYFDELVRSYFICSWPSVSEIEDPEIWKKFPELVTVPIFQDRLDHRASLELIDAAIQFIRCSSLG